MTSKVHSVYNKSLSCRVAEKARHASMLLYHFSGTDRSIGYDLEHRHELECGPMPNVMVALPNIGGAFCSTPQSLADAHYLTAVQ